MQIQALTFDQLIGAAAIILLMIGIYNTVMGAIKTAREEKKRKDQPVVSLEEKVDGHEEKLAKDHQRLNALEDSNRIIMRALMAIMSHEINGNDTVKLQSSFEEIQKYLIER
jgi:hypothetical protein